MSVEFTDNTAKVSAALSEGIVAFLHEIGSTTLKHVHRNSRVDTGNTKGSYDYVVDEGENESTVIIGSPLENAIWEEFGTGEYALHGDGRKGGWYIPEEKLNAKAKSKMKKVIGKNGKVYYYTRGKKPNQPLTKAFQTIKPKIKKQLVNVIKQNLGG